MINREVKGEEHIGRFIRKRREVLRMTQKHLGAKLGYKYGNFIALLEGANASFPVEKWSQYADALEVPRHEFLKKVISTAFPDMRPYLRFVDPTREAQRRELLRVALMGDDEDA